MFPSTSFEHDINAIPIMNSMEIIDKVFSYLYDSPFLYDFIILILV